MKPLCHAPASAGIPEAQQEDKPSGVRQRSRAGLVKAKRQGAGSRA